MTRGVKRERLSANIPSIGYGYVFLPEGVDREKYIKSCYRKEKVSIYLDQGGSVVFDCYVTRQTLQEITFPNIKEELGSMVGFVSMEFNNKPIIFGVISKNQESQLLKENYYKVFKTKDGNYASISVDGNGQIYLSVKGKSSKIKLDVDGGTLDVNSKGNITVNSDSEIDINSTAKVQHSFLDQEGNKSVKLIVSSEGLKYEDTSGNTFQIDKKNGKISMFNGIEPLLLGTTTQTQLNQNNTYLEQLELAITTALVALDALVPGISSTFTSTMSTAIKGDYSKIKSQKSFTD